MSGATVLVEYGGELVAGVQTASGAVRLFTERGLTDEAYSLPIVRTLRPAPCPAGAEIGRRQAAEAEHERKHGADEATARAIVRGAASARTHEEAADTIRSAADRYGGSDGEADRMVAGIIGAESRRLMEAARAALEARRAEHARELRLAAERDRAERERSR